MDKKLERIKTQLLKLQNEFERFTKRWDDVVDKNEKMTKSINDLSTTTSKINKQYVDIYTKAELDGDE